MLAVEIETGGSAGVYYPPYDGNGNITPYMGSTHAHVVANYEYDAFGEVTVASGSNPSLFTYRFPRSQWVCGVVKTAPNTRYQDFIAPVSFAEQ